MTKGRTRNIPPREYCFKMDVFRPATIPMKLLAQYLQDLAMLLGSEESVHLISIRDGSTVLAMPVDFEAEPKVLDRLARVRNQDGPPEAMRAAKAIDERLRQDNAKGAIVGPRGNNVLSFPGRDLNKLIEYGPFNQPGTLIGTPIRIGGEQHLVPVHLEEHGRHGRKYVCEAARATAKEIAQYLFTGVIRAEGIGRWIRRRSGDWEMLNFTIKDFKPLPDNVSFKESIERLRAIPATWKELEDPIDALMHLRHGTDG